MIKKKTLIHEKEIKKNESKMENKESCLKRDFLDAYNSFSFSYFSYDKANSLFFSLLSLFPFCLCLCIISRKFLFLEFSLFIFLSHLSSLYLPQHFFLSIYGSLKMLLFFLTFSFSFFSFCLKSFHIF